MSPHQAAACVLAFMLITPLGLLLIARIRYARNQMEKVFPENEWAVWKQGSLYFEDFYNKTHTIAQRKVQHLDCSISFVQPDANKTINEIYEVSAKNLKHAAPGLKFLALNGGYIYNPGNATIDNLKLELEQLRDYFSIVLNIIKQSKWTITNFDFNGVIVLDQELAKNSKFTSLISQVFNVSAVDSRKKQMDAKFQFDVENVTIHVFLSVTDAELFGQAPQGRSKFYLPRMRIGIPPGGRH